MTGPRRTIVAGVPDWTRAACNAEPIETFYPAEGVRSEVHLSQRDIIRERQRAARAKLVCTRCPIRSECLDYALSAPEIHGIWGGKSERERRTMRGVIIREERRVAQHGTRSKYQAGCRCRPCRDANAAYKRQLKGAAS